MTRLLLDTHLLLWWLKGDPRLPEPVVERVQAAVAQLVVNLGGGGQRRPTGTTSNHLLI